MITHYNLSTSKTHTGSDLLIVIARRPPRQEAARVEAEVGAVFDLYKRQGEVEEQGLTGEQV
jgi:hypothetical protein